MNAKLKSSFSIAALLVLATSASAMTPEERESYRHMLLLNLPQVPQFEQWIQRKNELPPDFDALPKINGLPDPLTFLDGRQVKTAADWKARRAEILDLYQKYVWGTIPPHPKLDRVEVTQETAGQGFKTRSVVLHVGPEGRGTMRVTLQIPDGAGPFPVVMGPNLAGGFGGGRGGAPRGGPAAPGATAPARGAQFPVIAGPGGAGAAPGRGPAAGPGAGGTAGIIRAHGYIVASVTASDGSDDSINIGALYPEADPGALPRRGWSFSTVVDYLLTLPEVDGKKIAVTGYSRDGKMATIAAALDERITAVIAGSPGVGGILPFRLAGERNMAESIQSTTLMFPDWFHPRFRYFAGREDRLPVDGNLLLAAIAPRPFFLVAGNNDEVANNWGDEQSFHSAEKVYQLLDGPSGSDKMGINRVPGYHGANDWEASMNWLDQQFGKSDKKWTNQWMFPWNYEKWKKADGRTVDVSKTTNRGALPGAADVAAWEKRADLVRNDIKAMLGDPTPAANPVLTPTPLPNNPPDVAQWAIRRSVQQGLPEFGWYAADNAKVATRAVTFNGINATLYFPVNAPADAKLPTAIWLHSYSYPLGYTWVYHRELHPILALVAAGNAVLAYDQAGFGTRMNEAAAFYDKTPRWSHMGKMVADARAAVDMLSKDAAVDPKRISLFGYAMGGNVALYTAALEPRVSGVVSICGFTPMRTDTAEKKTGGLGRYAVERGLLPQLGAYIGNESKLPYDYDELIAAIAPRPVYVVNSKYDRDATPEDVHNAVEAARKVYALYKADEKLKLDEPFDYNRLSIPMQDRIIMWMSQNIK